MSGWFPRGLSLSIGGERIPMTMQAEVESMTPEQALESGLFDLPDESGMVRFPVSIQLEMTSELLAAIERAEAASMPRDSAPSAGEMPQPRRAPTLLHALGAMAPFGSGPGHDDWSARGCAPWQDFDRFLDALDEPPASVTPSSGRAPVVAAEIDAVLARMRRTHATPHPAAAFQVAQVEGGPGEKEAGGGRLNAERRPMTPQE